jgi:hypothetical protein
MWYGCNKTVPVSTTASPLSFPWEGLLFAGSPKGGRIQVVAQFGKITNRRHPECFSPEGSRAHRRTAVPVHLRCAPDPSQIRVTPLRNGEIQLSPVTRFRRY